MVLQFRQPQFHAQRVVTRECHSPFPLLTRFPAGLDKVGPHRPPCLVVLSGTLLHFSDSNGGITEMTLPVYVLSAERRRGIGRVLSVNLDNLVLVLYTTSLDQLEIGQVV